MGVIKYDIRESAFRRSRAEFYELSILLGMDSFAYVVKDTATAEVVAFRSVDLQTDDLSQWADAFSVLVSDDELLRLNLFRATRVAVLTPRLTLVPSRLYDPGAAREYLEQLTTLSLEDRVRADEPEELPLRLVFAIAADRMEVIQHRLLPRHVRHLATTLLPRWAALTGGAHGSRGVFALLRNQRLLVAVCQAGKVLLVNVFETPTADDVLYFTLLAFRQTGLPPHTVPLFLCGEIMRESEVYRRLFTYIEDIRFLAPPAGTGTLGPELNKLPGHLFYDLLAI